MVCKYQRFVHNLFANRVIKGSQKKGSMLDIGTGTGQIIIELAKKDFFREIMAMDSSSYMLDMSRKNAKNIFAKRKITFCKADFLQYNFGEKKFDTICCHNTLHHFVDPQKAIEKMISILRPGGAIFIQDIFRPSEWIIPVYIFVFAGVKDIRIRKQYRESLMASLSVNEWKILFKKIKLEGSCIKYHFPSHISISKKDDCYR